MNETSIRVLLVENNPRDVGFVRAGLADVAAGQFELTHVERLSEAEQRLREECYDVILLDLSLPDTHGLATLTGLRKHESTVPIVALSDTEDEALALQAVQEGAQDYLTKGRTPGPAIARVLRYAVERKRVEEALRESEERYRLLSEFSSDWIYWCSPAGDVLHIAAACAEVTGYTPQEFKTTPRLFDTIIHPDDRAAWDRHDHTAPTDGPHERLEFRIVTKEGQTRWISHVCRPVYNDAGEFLGTRGSNHDITERKRTEEALQQAHDELETRVEERTKELARSNEELYRAKEAADAANQAKSEFLAKMSHEIRTPLHGILSFARFGVDTALTAEPDKLLDYFQKIDTCGKRLMILLSDVLDLAKMESGNMQFQFKPTDIRTVLRSALNDFSSLLAERDITIDYAEPDSEVLLTLDPNRLAQVIGNVLSNAAKYTPGGGTIRVDVNRSDEGVRVSIRDNGVGIPEEELATIFDKFVQSSKTDSGAGGTGLGLSICREIVEAHQGRVWAENRPEGGAIFHILLPLMMDTGSGGEQADRSCAEKTDLDDVEQTMTVKA